MMQAIQIQYAAGTHNAHQDYGFCGYRCDHANYRDHGGRGAQRRGNWKSGRGGRVNRDLTHYCWNHGVCARPGKDCRTSEEGHKKDAVWCHKMSGSERNCTWQVGSLPASKTNVEETKPSYKYGLLCISIVDPPQNATIIAKYDSGASNNYCHTEHMLVITNIKDTHDGPTFQLPNNTTINSTKTESIAISRSLSIHAKQAHLFGVLHISLLISLVQLCDDDCIAILDNNEMSILKTRHLF